MPIPQFDLFGEPDPGEARVELPSGFRYQRDIITAAEESELLAHVRALPFRDFEFHGYTGKRRVVSFGWQYDFSNETLRTANDMPDFLLALRDVAARFAGMDTSRLQHVLITE